MQPPPPTASTAAVSQDNATADLSFTQALNQTTPEEDTNIFVAAQRGDVATLRALLDSGHARATDRNTQNITPLHWAAINAQLPACRLLLDPVGVDSRDAQGHTALMWAAYQGDALSVDLLLRHGASPTVQDDAGLTPLHWAVVRGNRVAIRRLVEKGAVLGAKDAEGRTPRDMAVELKSLGAWRRALEEGGWDEEGVKRKTVLGERNTRLAIFALPTLVFGVVFMTLAGLPWYTGVLLAVAEFFGMHH
ncbi:ankyrin repeat-containing domain protein [Mycena olivaceomarginata]|nr:ankyrin repeat-containing domain protein [Mycena olivaceomarginata]